MRLYDRLILHIFQQRYQADGIGFEFPRDAITQAAADLGVEPPRNVGDLIYSFRSRSPLPSEIRATAPEGQEWLIRSVGDSRYRFELRANTVFAPSPQLAETLIPDGTPALIHLYRQSDEQALLAIIRYNRLVDVFTRISCFSVQSHLRTNLAGIGQIEVDELYVGIDRRGAHYVLPIEVKAASDRLGINQIENMFALCEARFPQLIARPLAAQFISDDLLALFEFERAASGAEVVVAAERHYRLAPAEEFSDELLTQYGRRGED